MQSINYGKILLKIVNHTEERFFLLDYGSDYTSISIFAYQKVLKMLGISRIPRINNFITLTAFPEKEFLEKYNISFRWLSARPSKKSRKLKELYSKTYNVNVQEVIKKGYISGDSDNYFIDEWGIKWKRSAYYFEMVEHPLEGKSLEDIKKYKLPDPTDRLRVEDLNKELATFYNENPDYITGLKPIIWGTS